MGENKRQNSRQQKRDLSGPTGARNGIHRLGSRLAVSPGIPLTFLRLLNGTCCLCRSIRFSECYFRRGADGTTACATFPLSLCVSILNGGEFLSDCSVSFFLENEKKENFIQKSSKSFKRYCCQSKFT